MKYIFLFSASLFIFITGCKKHFADEDKIRVENKLNKKIICVLGYNYPDLKLDFTSKQALLDDSCQLQADTGETIIIDTAGLCKKETWNKHVKKSLLMLFVFDKKKLLRSNNLEDALIERYYFSYIQIVKIKGLITVY
jgi:hypothetical protein